MIREIIHDPAILSKKSSPATIMDINVAKDLLDTLKANADECVGMAANMIGVLKCVIVFDNNGERSVMFNPVILDHTGEYEITEGCLSLGGKRKTKRYRIIKVRYQDMSFKTVEDVYSGWTAEIIQHEIDHCNGILI